MSEQATEGNAATLRTVRVLVYVSVPEWITDESVMDAVTDAIHQRWTKDQLARGDAIWCDVSDVSTNLIDD